MSGMDKFIGYLTTVKETSQKSAESVGESMKTMYARWGNVKLGKWEPEKGEEFDESEFENLNDIETSLEKVGIKYRESATELRNYDEVMDEIGTKWKSFDQVTQNALAGALAGTRQRENALILFENWDKVGKFAEIAGNAQGTASEKMLAYNDSLEASQKRVTAAFEEFVMGKDIQGGMKILNNTFTGLIKSLNTLLTLGGLFAAVFAFPQIVKGFQLMGLHIAKMTNDMQSIGKGSFYKGKFTNISKEIEEEREYIFGNKKKENDSSLVTSARQAGSEIERSGSLFSNFIKGAIDNFRVATGQITQEELSTEREKRAIALAAEREKAEIGKQGAVVETNTEIQGAGIETNIETQDAGTEVSNEVGGGQDPTNNKSTKRLITEGIATSLGSLAGGVGGAMIGESINGSQGAVVGGMLGSTVTGLASMIPVAGPWISLGLGAVTGLFGYMAKQAEEAKKKVREEGQKISQELTDSTSKYVELSSKSFKDKFGQLSQGVGSDGKNVSLSDEQFSEYRGMLDKILGATPELIDMYDAEGNALSNRNDVLEDSIRILKEETEAKRKSLYSPEQMKQKWDDNYKATFKNEDSPNKKIEENKKKQLEIESKIKDNDKVINSSTALKYFKEEAKANNKKYNAEIIELQKSIPTLQKDLAKAKKGMQKDLMGFAGAEDEYENMSDAGKKMVSEFIKGVNLEDVSEKDFEEFQTKTEKSITDMIQSLGKGDEASTDLQDSVNNYFKLKSDPIATTKAIEEAKEKLITQIYSTFPKEFATDMLITLGFIVGKPDGKGGIVKVDGKQQAEEGSQDAPTYTTKDGTKVQVNKSEDPVIKGIKEKALKAEREGKITSDQKDIINNFADDKSGNGGQKTDFNNNFKKVVEKGVSDINSLKTAIDSFNPEIKKSLIDKISFPDLESNVEQFEKLGEAIKNFRKNGRIESKDLKNLQEFGTKTGISSQDLEKAITDENGKLALNAKQINNLVDETVSAITAKGNLTKATIDATDAELENMGINGFAVAGYSNLIQNLIKTGKVTYDTTTGKLKSAKATDTETNAIIKAAYENKNLQESLRLLQIAANGFSETELTTAFSKLELAANNAAGAIRGIFAALSNDFIKDPTYFQTYKDFSVSSGGDYNQKFSNLLMEHNKKNPNSQMYQTASGEWYVGSEKSDSDTVRKTLVAGGEQAKKYYDDLENEKKKKIVTTPKLGEDTSGSSQPKDTTKDKLDKLKKEKELINKTNEDMLALQKNEPSKYFDKMGDNLSKTLTELDVIEKSISNRAVTKDWTQLDKDREILEVQKEIMDTKIEASDIDDARAQNDIAQEEAYYATLDENDKNTREARRKSLEAQVANNKNLLKSADTQEEIYKYSKGVLDVQEKLRDLDMSELFKQWEKGEITLEQYQEKLKEINKDNPNKDRENEEKIKAFDQNIANVDARINNLNENDYTGKLGLVKEKENLIKDKMKVPKDLTVEEQRAYESALKGIVDEKKSLISGLKEEYLKWQNEIIDGIQKQKESLDWVIKKETALTDLAQKRFDITNQIREAEKDIKKDLSAARTMSQWLDKDTRKLLFNEEDFSALSSTIIDIKEETDALGKQFYKDLNNLTEDNIYLEEFITKEYQKRVEMKMKELEIAKAELNLHKKELELNNVLAEKNVKMFTGGEWQYVSNTEDVKNAQEAIIDAQSAIDDLRTKQAQQEEIDKAEAHTDNLKKQQSAYDSQVAIINKASEKMTKSIDALIDPIMDITSIMQQVSDFGITSFSKALNALTLKIGNAIGTDYSKDLANNNNKSGSTGTDPRGVLLATFPDGHKENVATLNGKVTTENLPIGTIIETAGGKYVISGGTAGNYKSVAMTNSSSSNKKSSVKMGQAPLGGSSGIKYTPSTSTSLISTPKKPMIAANANGTKFWKGGRTRINELGDELQIPNPGYGDVEDVKIGTQIVPSQQSENILKWGGIDPDSMRKPEIKSNMIDKSNNPVYTIGNIVLENVTNGKNFVSELNQFLTSTYPVTARG